MPSAQRRASKAPKYAGVQGFDAIVLRSGKSMRRTQRPTRRRPRRAPGPDGSLSGLAGAKIAVISETPACLAGRNCALWGVAPRLRSTAERGAPAGETPRSIRSLGGVLCRDRPTPALRLMACAAGCVDDEMGRHPRLPHFSHHITSDVRAWWRRLAG